MTKKPYGYYSEGEKPDRTVHPLTAPEGYKKKKGKRKGTGELRTEISQAELKRMAVGQKARWGRRVQREKYAKWERAPGKRVTFYPPEHNPGKEKWIAGAIEKPGALTSYVRQKYGKEGFTEDGKIRKSVLLELKRDPKLSPTTRRRASLALTLRKIRAEKSDTRESFEHYTVTMYYKGGKRETVHLAARDCDDAMNRAQQIRKNKHLKIRRAVIKDGVGDVLFAVAKGIGKAREFPEHLKEGYVSGRLSWLVKRAKSRDPVVAARARAQLKKEFPAIYKHIAFDEV